MLKSSKLPQFQVFQAEPYALTISVLLQKKNMFAEYVEILLVNEICKYVRNPIGTNIIFRYDNAYIHAIIEHKHLFPIQQFLLDCIFLLNIRSMTKIFHLDTFLHIKKI